MAEETTGVQGKPFDVPRVSPTNFVIQGSQVELAVLCMTQAIGPGSESGFVVAGLPVAQLNLNYVVAKQLAAALSLAVGKYESDFGEIPAGLVTEPQLD